MERPGVAERRQQLGASTEDCVEMDSEFVAKINRYCQSHKYTVVYDTIGVTGPSHDPLFTVVVKINGEAYGEGTGKSKKEAKAGAAKRAWEVIKKQHESPSNMAAAELMTTESSPPMLDRDYISLLNTYSQKTLKGVVYSKKTCTGDAHVPTYYVSCTVGGVLYGEGSGPSVIAAKRVAAKEAYEKVHKENSLMRETEKLNGNCTGSQYSNSFSQVPNESDVCSGSAAKLVEKMKDMAIYETPSSSQKNTPSSVPKPKRKLAANFGNGRNKEEKMKMSDVDTNIGEDNGSPHTVNKTFLEHFKNIEPIGEGGFGNVFKATSKCDKTTYAIKRVEFTEKVEREAEGLARLTHENIVRYHSSWKGNDLIKYPDSSWNSDKEICCLFIQMEFCEQGTLEKWIAKTREDRKYYVMAQNKFLQIVKGVEYIHSVNLIHRDLKPQNIFISHDDKIKIGDFGLVTSMAFETLTEDRGTKSYMAPEQSGPNYGKEIDIYALGLIWFEILSAMTHHEKAKVWPSVRKGVLPEDFTKKFLAEAPVIQKMLSTDPSGRISISSLLLLFKSDDNEKPCKNYSC